MRKKLIYILILFIISAPSSLAKPKNTALKATENIMYKFKTGEDKVFLDTAERNMQLSKNAKNKSDKKFYLQKAMRYYFLLEQADKSSIESQIGLGRVYDEMGLDSLAKKHFFNAYNYDNQNPRLNLYFADFYYKRNDFIIALRYYNTAYKNGFSNSYYLNYRLGNIYEKLGDIENAKRFYKKALELSRNNKELSNRIKSLDELNYSQSQYYLFNK